jgi:lysophospholipase L1-like esterase
LSSCKTDQKTVLVIGDSWAFLTCLHGSLELAFKKAGLANAAVNSSCKVTSVVGAHARDWLSSPQHDLTLTALKDPSVRVVYVSLGGNDVINLWNKNMSPQQLENLVAQLKAKITEIINVYKGVRPDVQFLVSGYDYPRFTPNHPIPDYAEAFESMGSPMPSEINRALVVLSERFLSLSEIPNTAFVHHLGLMHYHFGHFEAGVLPKTTKIPSRISKPGERLNTYGGITGLSSDTPAMESLIGENIVVDAFHLSKLGYHYMAEHTVEQYLKDWLK